MTKMKIYPSGEKAAETNQEPQVMDLEVKTHACGKEGMQNPGNPTQKRLTEAGLAIAAPLGVYAGIEVMGFGMKTMGAGTDLMNAYRTTQEPADLGVGAGAWVGGFGAFGGGAGLTLLSAYVGTKMVQKFKRAYQNSTAAQKINPVMRKVGNFLAKNARRAVEKVRDSVMLTEMDTMHKGKYHYTIVPGKDGQAGHTYVNPVKKFMNRFRDTSR